MDPALFALQPRGTAFLGCAGTGWKAYATHGNKLDDVLVARLLGLDWSFANLGDTVAARPRIVRVRVAIEPNWPIRSGWACFPGRTDQAAEGSHRSDSTSRVRGAGSPIRPWNAGEVVDAEGGQVLAPLGQRLRLPTDVVGVDSQPGGTQCQHNTYSNTPERFASQYGHVP